MPAQRNNRAILVLEAPWKLDERDANRSSVLPFVQGVAGYRGDVDVLYAKFYDAQSFRDGLASLCVTPYKDAVLYIAAHGSPSEVGADLTEIFLAVRRIAGDFNIRGVLLGSCYAGLATKAHQIALEGSELRWVIGYATESAWLTGTMIDCALLEEAIGFTAASYGRDNLIRRFSRALAPFSPHAPIGDDWDENEATALRDSLQIIVQSPGRGNRAAVISEDVFEAHDAWQV